MSPNPSLGQLARLLICSLLFGLSRGHAQVQINEIMASNSRAYPDVTDFEDYPDWFELKNTTGSSVSLAGYFISDDPATELLQGEVRAFLVLFADAAPEAVRDYLRLVRALPRLRQRELCVGICFCPRSAENGPAQLLFQLPSFRQIPWDDPAALSAFAAAIYA